MSKLLQVIATRAFNGHNVGDVLLVAETAEIKALVAARLFVVIEVVKSPEVASEPKAKRKPKAKADV